MVYMNKPFMKSELVAINQFVCLFLGRMRQGVAMRLQVKDPSERFRMAELSTQ